MKGALLPKLSRASISTASLEVRHGYVAFAGDVAGPYEGRCGPQEDDEVEAEAPLVDVPDVELELLLPADRVSAVNLRPTGDAGHHVVPARLLAVVERQVLHEEGPGPDQREL